MVSSMASLYTIHELTRTQTLKNEWKSYVQLVWTDSQTLQVDGSQILWTCSMLFQNKCFVPFSSLHCPNQTRVSMHASITVTHTCSAVSSFPSIGLLDHSYIDIATHLILIAKKHHYEQHFVLPIEVDRWHFVSKSWVYNWFYKLFHDLYRVIIWYV